MSSWKYSTLRFYQALWEVKQLSIFQLFSLFANLPAKTNIYILNYVKKPYHQHNPVTVWANKYKRWMRNRNKFKYDLSTDLTNASINKKLSHTR